MNMFISPYEDLCRRSYDAVVRSAQPLQCLKEFVPAAPEKGRLVVVGAGKAAASMAAAFEDLYEGTVEGMVITRYGHGVPTRKIRVIEAAHPIPDQAGCDAVAEMLAFLSDVGVDDTVVCLISGGGSSLLSRPVDGVSFSDLQDVQRQLLGCGASIDEVNCVRKHLNVALGGGLAQAASAARMITLAISDVVGDDPQVIASGASVADDTTLSDARSVLERYNISVPEAVRDALNNPLNETPKSGDAVFERNEYHLVATPKQALEAARQFWEKNGVAAMVWNGEVTGGSEDAALDHVRYVESLLGGGGSFPCAVLSGGETTMTLKEECGQGGPNTHFILKAAIALNGNDRVYAMACDTDGIDGYGDQAGAVIAPDTLCVAEECGLDPVVYLDRQDSRAFFDSVGGLVVTGPSHTNVNDYRVFLLLPENPNRP